MMKAGTTVMMRMTLGQIRMSTQKQLKKKMRLILLMKMKAGKKTKVHMYPLLQSRLRLHHSAPVNRSFGALQGNGSERRQRASLTPLLVRAAILRNFTPIPRMTIPIQRSTECHLLPHLLLRHPRKQRKRG
ncbi:hypothetical protein SERLADRAFT_460108 [Serpula lacrymans var. lacrymans S7.9]|uniref:Uncharacterized protein n=1 Tax=Serpula lacrymans var. lacrymans (strain S7.9) TaxID=578457 RepID=F8NPG4_SERL9|nr:uncharacterized protein SERLADRAFT_460108 [Serpula lacrymans var. lacrymans S7.9]EGO27174.1 hypothetical protein SERLADRAFT_460108 [Serpula lacrymans var. lacrymans S7.9]